ncbi:hypothetical protein B0H11DRAFT_1911924 [Mycena galericulata]|nr:hypothetical protein B0H11DRAFT_1911924 [Mycena galericulata]
MANTYLFLGTRLLLPSWYMYILPLDACKSNAHYTASFIALSAVAAPPSSLISLQESGSTRLLRVLSSGRTSRPLIWAWNRGVFSKRNTKQYTLSQQSVQPHDTLCQAKKGTECHEVVQTAEKECILGNQPEAFAYLRSVALQSQTLDVRPEDNTLKRRVLPDSCNEIREDGGAQVGHRCEGKDVHSRKEGDVAHR